MTPVPGRYGSVGWRLAVRVRRWWLPLALTLAAAIVGWLFGTHDAAIPTADGPRVVRQYLIVGLPALIAPMLIDRIPEMSAALVREPRLRLMDQSLATGAIAVVLGIAWARSGLPLDLLLYELCIALLFLDWILLGCARWGLLAVLVTSLAAILWLLAGDTVAKIMGFGSLGAPPPGMTTHIASRGLVILAAALIALPASFALGASWRWRQP